MIRYPAKVISVLEDGDAIIEFDPAMLEELGWQEGDVLDISVDEDNRIVLKKVTE